MTTQKTSFSRTLSSAKMGLLACISLAISGNLSALPSGHNVTHGDATVATAGSTTTVTQTSNRAVIQWANYNLGATETVRYEMNPNDAVLNIINQGSRSLIDGTITGQGQIFLINPHGITFGTSARISAGTFIASSLMVDEDDFINGGLLNFYSTTVRGSIINNGIITASAGGNVALLGHSVANNFRIFATRGKVVLAAGEAMTLDFDGTGLIQVAVTEGLTSRVDNIENAVSNTGLIAAGDGRVVLEAHVAANVFTSAVNHQGLIRAEASTTGEDGVVRLVGNGGRVIIGEQARILSQNPEIIEILPNQGQPTPTPTPSLNPSTLQSALANSNDPASTGQIGNASNTSLGLYSVESPGVKLPADQLEEEI